MAPQQAAPRMPAIEEFPPIAQRQIAAQQNRIETIAEHSVKKRRGIFERLANVGMGRRDEQAAPAPRSEPAMAQRPAAQSRMMPQEPAPQAEATYEDDQLAIPAFLRRQAHG